ncbi:hypothetical protein MLD38_014414 [Melastoma candidum]|uniref:Uncharacterized protein n=1 Tax=Melastoma candidum TaxID=119954 RepID=A0ACB9RCM5_9MYRT|nr:hypothetical protein MLD38_014414 [Melastoma candidum]
MELQLGLALPKSSSDHDVPPSEASHHVNLDLNMGVGCGSERQQYRQPRHDERTRRTTVPRTLPLLHGVDREGNRYDEEEEEEDDDDYMDTDSSSYRQPNSSKYVKVGMEGIGIGRKVDLSLHHSLHSLKHTLLPMFGIYNEDSDNYKLSYQDRGGHWVVAEDSSWREFIRCAQRLKMVRVSHQERE